MSVAVYVKNLKEQNPERYANVGKPWNDEEIVELLSNVQKKLTHFEIAEKHARTSGSILAKLKGIAADYYFNDEFSIDKIKKYTRLSIEEISDAISRRQYEIDKKSSKNNEVNPISDPLHTKTPTRDDFYDTIHELLTVAKDIQRMMKEFHTDNFITKN